ncbi:MAG: zinc dependent phospholipase C family protein [Ileibacterium sp.]|nr:zinc dependent phospholipase C family protein [Ileibacterium sp.]
MPNIITHTLFADDMIEQLELDMLKDNRQLVQIGSSGPDILFFHHLPWKAYVKTPLHKMGSQLHRGQTYEFYKSVLESVKKEKNPEIQQQMISYAIGHLFHWALDSTIHPYVFYRTGNCKGQSSANHHRFESLMDAIMLKVKRNTTIREYDVSQAVCDTRPDQKRAIARVYVPALEAVFGQSVRPYMISETLEDWKAMQKLFRDPDDVKAGFFRALEKPAGKDNLFSGYSVPAVVEDNWDIMNLLHKEWKHPVTEDGSTESVFDLFDKAKIRAAKAAQLFLAACAMEEREEEFLDFVKDINYDTEYEDVSEVHCFELADLSI